MKTLYFECNMGAAGDMLTSSLLDLFDNKNDEVEKLNNLGIPNVKYIFETTTKCGINGSHVKVLVGGIEESVLCEHHEHEHEHEHSHEHHHDHEYLHEHHHHTSLNDIQNIVSKLNVSSKVKENVMNVYKIIAQAESAVHGITVEEIHFHEVGAMDAVADITAVCFLLEELNAEKIICSPINTGKGQVHCAHGILPVPAPATSLILKNIPSYSNEISGELCTPTGAALLKYFSKEFVNRPVMQVSKIGYGMGNKDFDAANCVRVFYGNTIEAKESICELRCNVDDMTGEQIGFAMERLFEEGAVEVFTTPIGMKKNRPGILLTCLCSESIKDKIVKAIFKHTSTIGIREFNSNRYVLNRTEKEVQSNYGTVKAKVSTGYGVTKTKLEYNDVAKLAKENNISISDVKLV